MNHNPSPTTVPTTTPGPAPPLLVRASGQCAPATGAPIGLAMTYRAVHHGSVNGDDPRDLVRHGYDALSYRYRADDAADGNYGSWLAALRARIPAGSAVLDLGCGNGVPVARHLAAAGYNVTGVDISEVQIRRARRLVPAATFLHGDITTVSLPEAAFDAVVCLYTLIHLPLQEQPSLLSRIAGWLRPEGWLLVTTGHRAWTGTEDGWLGGTVPMWWSHADAATYRTWLQAAGLQVTTEDFVPEGDGGHALFWAHRR